MLLAVSAATAASECPVEFSFDISHSELLLAVIADGEVSAWDVEQLLAHPGTADVLRKTRSYGLDVDGDDLVAQVRQLAAGEEISDISFGLGRYNARKARTAALVAGLTDDFPRVRDSICDRLAPYVPEGGHFKQTVVVLSAVNSSGFTFDDPSRVYVVAEAFDGDLWGLADLVVHESYHAIQDRLTADNPMFQEDPGLPGTANSALRLLAGTILEGTATHVADPIEAGNEGAMREFQYNLARRYRRDLPHQFTLLDTTLFRAFHDPGVDYSDLHRIGLEGNEAFYHVGAMMTKVIAEADGPTTIPSYFRQSPVAFFRRYQALAESAGDLPRFSSSTQAILGQLGRVTSVDGSRANPR